MLAVQMTGLSWWQGSADYATIWVVVIGVLKAIGSMLGIPVGRITCRYKKIKGGCYYA